MLFSIDEDVGERVVGWVMPDNPAVTPRIVVHLAPDNHVVVDAFVYRPLLKQRGLHNTGICGFALDENNCRGLTNADKLEIYDGDNHLLIYRRRPSAGLIDKKFFRLEPQLFRSVAVDALFQPQFHMSYPALGTPFGGNHSLDPVDAFHRIDLCFRARVLASLGTASAGPGLHGRRSPAGSL